VNSHLLEGKVRHRRARPFVYELDHDVYYFALDLDELDEVDRRLRLVSRNRRNVVSFRDADHLPTPATDLAVDIRAHLRREGEDPTDWRIILVANLRVAGYVFNPASFYLCRDREGALRMVVVEVHNTFGERHLYTLRSSARGGPFTDTMAKDFYVSPFISLDGRYTVHVRDDDRGVRIAIALRQDGEQLLSTSLVLHRRPLRDRTLLRMLIRHPLISHKTIGFIHWHALRLWLRGARFHRHGGWRERVPAIEAPGRGATR
jgi:DUF1365 family protein